MIPRTHHTLTEKVATNLQVTACCSQLVRNLLVNYNLCHWKWRNLLYFLFSCYNFIGCSVSMSGCLGTLDDGHFGTSAEVAERHSNLSAELFATLLWYVADTASLAVYYICSPRLWSWTYVSCRKDASLVFCMVLHQAAHSCIWLLGKVPLSHIHVANLLPSGSAICLLHACGCL